MQTVCQLKAVNAPWIGHTLSIHSHTHTQCHFRVSNQPKCVFWGCIRKPTQIQELPNKNDQQTTQDLNQDPSCSRNRVSQFTIPTKHQQPLELGQRPLTSTETLFLPELRWDQITSAWHVPPPLISPGFLLSFVTRR